MSIRDIVPTNWGLAPTFGEDLLFEGAVEAPKVSKADRARAVGVPVGMLDAHYTDEQVVNLSPFKWAQYRRVLRSRGQHSEVTRLSNLLSIADEKKRCPGEWNPKTGCRERDWYYEARDIGQEVLHEVASSPITQAAFTVASFTPLAPVAVPLGTGLQAADRLAQGGGISEGLVAAGVSALGVPEGAVPIATEIGEMAVTQELDVTGLSDAAAQAVGVPEGAVRIGRAAATGDVAGLTREAAAAVGVPPGAVRIGKQVSKVQQASRAAKTALKRAQQAQGKKLQQTARDRLRAPAGLPPSKPAGRSLLRKRW